MRLKQLNTIHLVLIPLQGQLALTFRYIKDGLVVERFLQYISIYAHGAEYLTDVILDFFNLSGINIQNCRGQSYDNAANMSGQYSGLQARIMEVNSKAIYVPCASHSLNLVGVNAVNSCSKVVHFFQFVQKLYAHFLYYPHIDGIF